MVSYDGFMWFATQDGLNRFDGVQFEVFRKDPQSALNDNLIQTLVVDKQDRLWIGTGAGITLYDRRNGQFRLFRDVFGSNHAVGKAAIHNLAVDPKGRVWIATYTEGVVCFDPHTHQTRHYFAGNTIQKECYVDPNGQVWVCALNDVFRFDEQANMFWPLHLHERLHTQSLFRAMLLDRQGNLWAATSDDGAFMLRPNGRVLHFRQGQTTQHLSSNDVARLLCAADGRIWLGTRTGGICLYHPDTERFTYIQHDRQVPHSLAEDFVWQLYQDRQGLIWVGNSSLGIDKYDPRRFPFGLIEQNAGKTPNTLPDNMIFRLYGQGDELYIGTEAGGLAQYNVKTRRMAPFPPIDVTKGSAMQGETRIIVADSEGSFWFANWRELNEYDPKRRSMRAYPVTEPNRQMYVFGAHVLNDSPGRSREIWVAGHDGLTRFDLPTRRWKNWDDLPALKPIARHTTRLIYEHSAGRIWFGTLRTGLFVYDRNRQQLTSINARNGLTCSNIRSLRQVGQWLWIGTDCGLYQLDLTSYRVRAHYTTANGLPNDVIYGILEDQRGLLWITSNAGLTWFSPTSGVLKNFDVTDGLQSNEFNTNVSYKHPDGTLFFGGVNGISYFHPDKFRINPFVPPVRITGITVLDSAYNPSQPHLSLGPDENFIRFAFVALNFSNSRKNQYRYRLEGIDPRWVQAGQQRTANYTNLPPGDYVFRVKGSNADGIWNEQGASVRITIHPPFWATVWFRALLIGLMLAAIYGLYRYRLWQIRRGQEQQMAVVIQTQELERQRFAKELHDGIGTNLSALKLYLGELGEAHVSVEEIQRRSLLVLESSINDVRALVRDMHPRQLQQQGLTGAIASLVDLLNVGRRLTITYTVQDVAQQLPEAIEINAFRIVQELLQNALRHAPDSQVVLVLRGLPYELQIRYQDNGPGFDPYRPNVLAGNGLLNIRQRVDLLRGTYELQTSPGKATICVVRLPIEQ